MGMSDFRGWWLTLGALVIAAGATLSALLLRDAPAVVTAMAAPASLVISILALTVARSQAASARAQAQYAHDQVSYAAEQTRLAALATANAYRPIVLPAHDAVPVSAEASGEPHYPSIDAFTVPPRSAPSGVFLVDPLQRLATIRLRNVGSGPAILMPSHLSDNLGRTAELLGNPAIAAGDLQRYTATFPSIPPESEATVCPESPELRTLWSELVTNAQCRERMFLLTLHYLGVAPSAQAETAEALFDPRGTGRWQIVLRKEEEPRHTPGFRAPSL